MNRWIFGFAMFAIWAGMIFSPSVQTWRVSHEFSDQLLRMGPDHAIQAGYIDTMHEQNWRSTAFINLFYLSLPRGTTVARLKAPVRIYYGIRPDHVRVDSFENGKLRLAVDKIEVLSVDTDISNVELKTDVGWARLDTASGEEARKAVKQKFQRSKYLSAKNLLKNKDVAHNIEMALKSFIGKIPGVESIEIRYIA